MSLIVIKRCDVCRSDTGIFEVKPDDPRIHNILYAGAFGKKLIKVFHDEYEYICEKCKKASEALNVDS